MLRLYDYLDSGNGYKVRLLLAQLGLPYDRVEVNILQGESRTPEFLAKNPNGRIPLLEITPDRFLAESNAILCFLGEETHFIPTESWERAQMMQWLFFEQYSHEPYIATSRFLQMHFQDRPDTAAEIDRRRAGGYAALDVMERHLQPRDFFLGDRYTLADIALYAYTHVAHEGGFDLRGYPTVNAWLERVQQQPRYIAIGQT